MRCSGGVGLKECPVWTSANSIRGDRVDQIMQKTQKTHKNQGKIQKTDLHNAEMVILPVGQMLQTKRFLHYANRFSAFLLVLYEFSAFSAFLHPPDRQGYLQRGRLPPTGTSRKCRKCRKLIKTKQKCRKVIAQMQKYLIQALQRRTCMDGLEYCPEQGYPIHIYTYIHIHIYIYIYIYIHTIYVAP